MVVVDRLSVVSSKRSWKLARKMLGARCYATRPLSMATSSTALGGLAAYKSKVLVMAVKEVSRRRGDVRLEHEDGVSDEEANVPCEFWKN